MIQRCSISTKAPFAVIAPIVAILIPLFMPLRLSLVYGVLIPTLLLWFYTNRTTLKERYQGNQILKSFHLFLLMTFISSFFGINPYQSWQALFSLFFFSFTILLFEDLTHRFSAIYLIIPLLCGQALAALHSVIEGGLGGNLKRFFVGTVSESGQIALTLTVGVAVAYVISKQSKQAGALQYFSPIIFFILSSLVAFNPQLNTPYPLFLIAVALTAFITFYAIYVALRYLITTGRNFNKRSDATPFNGTKTPPTYPVKLKLALNTTILPLITCALLVNLKRGPWFGVLVGLTIFFTFFKRRIVIPLFLFAVILLLAITPLRTRLGDSIQDFNISGGRNIMWKIGMELSTRYPLGIGFNNSEYLQRFSAEIPKTHQHFHNNFINILVECGFFSFFFFLYWLLQICKKAFNSNTNSKYNKALQVGLGCALIAMMSAGLVEYNFGDSEVCILLLILTGILSGIKDTP